MNTVRQQPPESQQKILPLLLSAKESAALCNIGVSTWWSFKSQGRLPAPVKLGRRVLWRRSDIEWWIAAGAPNQERFELLKQDAERGRAVRSR